MNQELFEILAVFGIIYVIACYSVMLIYVRNASKYQTHVKIWELPLMFLVWLIFGIPFGSLMLIAYMFGVYEKTNFAN